MDTVVRTCLLVLFVSAQLGETAQCLPDSKNLCGAMCNGTYFDLSKAFDFPITIKDTSDLSGYTFIWDPCHGYKCPYDRVGNCAVCQSSKYSNFIVNCGQTINPIWLTEVLIDDNECWEIQYTFGADYRITVFKFVVDNKVEKPTVKYINEHPVLQYNFEVRGKCIGQQTYECLPHYRLRE